jgi:hypothetical protein
MFPWFNALSPTSVSVVLPGVAWELAVTEKVAFPEVVRVTGELAVTPAGKFSSVKETLPLRFTPTAAVRICVLPGMIVKLWGLTETVKSGGITTSVSGMVWVIESHVAVRVKG